MHNTQNALSAQRPNAPALLRETAQFQVMLLTGSPETPMAFRAIHDTDRGADAVPFDGPLAQCWPTIEHWSSRGYGIFVVVSELDGQGRKLENVAAIRAQYVDLDSGSVEANAQRAAQSTPAPWFAVASSPGRQHVYWPLSETYRDNDRFQTLQRKLAQEYGGDPQVIDATRVMRLGGTLNWKRGTPHLVTIHALSGMRSPVTIEALEAAYAHVQVIEAGGGTRHDLGDPDLAAPSLDWLAHAMRLIDPNQLDRAEWISITCAVKQAGWTLADPDTLFNMWSEWCGRYTANDIAENFKQWHSIRNTQLGWKSLVARVPALRASMAFGKDGPVLPGAAQAVLQPLDLSNEVLTHTEQAEYFRGFVYVLADRKIHAPNGVVYGREAFNDKFGGKIYVLNSQGKTTDEAWRAATRGTQWQVEKVEQCRFMPDKAPGGIIVLPNGTRALNTYRPLPIDLVDGDATRFVRHVELIVGPGKDAELLFDWMAHAIKFPGVKIRWAPVVQSVEGIGKNVLWNVMKHGIGEPYCHKPNSQQLAKQQFNGWMRNKLFILADEIKVDEKRNLVEVLKPLIADKDIEVESKGVDQAMADNCTNWFLFTNYKDAIPINANGRRYATLFSPLQTVDDLIAHGMGDDYFRDLFDWLDGDGCAIAVNWLMHRPVERGSLPSRAPRTASWDEAVMMGRSEEALAIMEAIETGEDGFRNGWLSTAAVNRVLRRAMLRTKRGGGMSTLVKEVGFKVPYGKQSAWHTKDDPDITATDPRTSLWRVTNDRDAKWYGADQGYVQTPDDIGRS